MQYVMIKFRPNDTKTFTYHNDTGVAAEVGGKVDVDTDRGWVTVDVIGVSDERPQSLPAHVKTKPIVRVRVVGAAPGAA